jgi:DNA polymerase III epsilon subunit-like protein
MLILFLDCETSGVNSNADQIIELSGAVFSLDKVTLRMDYVDKFSTLLRLRGKLDDRITRLTGITADELVDAPTLFQAQELWLEWLESHNSDSGIQAIIGHSVDFDISFLRKEKWFLPSCEIIDTLDLSRILLPYKSAINLEFLCKSLELESRIPAELIGNLSYHRSLFDTLVDAELFRTLLNILSSTVHDEFLIRLIMGNFLPLDFEIYGDRLNNNLRLVDGQLDLDTRFLEYNELDSESENLIDFDGTSLDFSNINSVINSLKDIPKTLKTLQNLAQNNPNRELILLIGQIYYAIIFITKNLNFKLKLHSLGESKTQFVLQKLILDVISPKVSNVISPVINPLESFLDKISLVVDQKVNCGTFVTQLELFLTLHAKRDLLTNKIQKLISQYDFLLITMQGMMQGKYEFNYKIGEAVGKELSAIKKLFEFMTKIIEFDFGEYDLAESEGLFGGPGYTGNAGDSEVGAASQNSPYTKLKNNLIEQIKETQKLFNFKNNQNIKINLFGTNLVVIHTNLEFDLEQYWNNFLDTHPKLTIRTELDGDSLSELSYLFELPQNQKSKLILNTSKAIGAIKYCELRIDQTIGRIFQKLEENPNQMIVVLTSVNATMAQVDGYIRRFNINNHKILVLGESGSLTKINSKIATGFQGLVVVKLSQINTLKNVLNKKKHLEIILIEEPLFIPHEFWRHQFKQYPDYREIHSKITKIYQEHRIIQLQKVFGKAKIVVNSLVKQSTDSR